MWIVMNDAFLSVVANEEDDETLLVRARVAGDIEEVFDFGEVDTWVDESADYPFRAIVPRELVASRIGERLVGIDYPNFKNSVSDPDRRSMCGKVWRVVLDWSLDKLSFRHRYGG